MKLKDFANINMGQSPKGDTYNSEGNGMPFMQGRKTFGRLFPFIDTWTSKPIKIAEEGDILMSVRAPVGDMNLCKQKICIGRGLCSIRAYNNNNKYLYYLLLNCKDELKKKSTGTVFDSVNKNDLENLDIPVHSENDQVKISYILSNIDEKIELNNEINNNLHELMETQFNRWIEDLEEYEESNLTTIANYTNGLAMQKFRPNENEKSLLVVKIKEMNSGISQDTERCSLDIKDEVKVYDGDILFAWSGTLCMTIWCGGNAGLNQHIFKVTSDKYPKWFYYFWTLKYLNKFKMIAEGKTTTMGHIQRKELDNSEVKLPREVELKRMNSIMEPLLEKYIANNVSNRTLEQLRDTLLPKLMNGEIELDNIEI